MKIGLKFTLKIETVVASFILALYIWKLRKEKVGGRKGRWTKPKLQYANLNELSQLPVFSLTAHPQNKYDIDNERGLVLEESIMENKLHVSGKYSTGSKY